MWPSVRRKKTNWQTSSHVEPTVTESLYALELLEAAGPAEFLGLVDLKGALEDAKLNTAAIQSRAQRQLNRASAMFLMADRSDEEDDEE